VELVVYSIKNNIKGLVNMENRKEQIVNIAIDFIEKYGFDSFSYKDLSQAVGITKATLHHHFPRKEDLGVAVCEKLKVEAKAIKSKIDKIGTAQEKIKYIFENLLSCAKAGDICPISSLQAEYNVIPDSMKAMVADLSEGEIDYLSEILEQGLEEGTFQFKGNPRSMALMILTSYKGAIQYSRVIDDNTIDTVMEQIYNQIMK
jgi:TetR/AcrR family transcriptional repressor of nem operon